VAQAEKRELKEKIGHLVAKQFGGDFRRAFDHYDASQDGKIDREELERLLKDADIGTWATRGLWANAIIAELDKDHDLRISRSELEAVLK
jgi:Ca2+-binding EF-hand superfamily protein